MMELRGCNHLHFISVIRGGQVIKLPNISREKKVLKFKHVLEIYVLNDSTCHDFLANNPPKVDRNLATRYVRDQIKTEIESAEEDGELDLGGMTLKQLQETCKSKKRKKSKSVNFMAVKQEANDTQQGEDVELKETLGSWKRKLFKRRKTKRNGTKGSSFITSESNSLRERSEAISDDLALHETNRQFFKPVMVKVEDAEPEHSQPQAINCILSYGPEEVTSEILGSVGPCSSKEAINRTLEDLQSSCLSGTSCELVEQRTPILVETKTCSLNQVSHAYKETQSWNPSQVSYEHQEYAQPQSPLMSESSKIEKTVELGGSGILGNQSTFLPAAELTEVEDMTDLTAFDKDPEPASECSCSDAHQVSLCIDKSVEMQGPNTYPLDNSQNIEFIDNGESSGSIDSKNAETEVIRRTVDSCSSAVTSDKCSRPTNDGAPRDTLTSAIIDKQLSTLDVTVASPTCSPPILPCEAIDEATLSAPSADCQVMEVVQPPERLFSARKTISPSSQRRLCSAMKVVDSRDDTETNYIKRHQTISKGTEALSSAEITSNPRQSRKGKDERKNFPSKGIIIKGPHASHSSPCSARGCSSVQSCSQNAIKFSQQQMLDIERLATKLVTELQSMKEIVVDVLHSESRACAKLRYNTDEVRVAVENATRVEETTRKWLSIMTRDCNRFCKIMTLAEANTVSPEAASPEKTVPKERKKIVFADEAGGRLCHVKVFEALEVGIGAALPVESQIKGEMLGA